MNTPHITFTRLARALGAQVDGVDLRAPLDDAVYEQLHAGLMEHQVLFFRNQELSDAEHLALATHFGAPTVRTRTPNRRKVADALIDPPVSRVRER